MNDLSAWIIIGVMGAIVLAVGVTAWIDVFGNRDDD